MLAHVENAVATGITYGALVPSMVAAYEEDDVRVGAGYTLREWQVLDWAERAREVAHYRLRRRVEMHIGDVQAKAARRRA